MRTLHRPLAFGIIGSWLAAGSLAFSQTTDAQPPDLASLLQELKRIREQQVAQTKQNRQQAYQQVVAAAANGERAASLWEDAVRATQFDGATKEGAAFKEWKEREGEGLNSKEGRNAARLFFTWLGLTMQRDTGMPVKDLLPQVVAYTKELAAHREMIENLEESIKKEKDLNSSGRHGMKRQGDSEKDRRMHDQILNKGLAGSPVVRWMRLEDFINPGGGEGTPGEAEGARPRRPGRGAAVVTPSSGENDPAAAPVVSGWEDNPGDYDGIFNNVILPELRAQKDVRILEYWDMRLKKEAEAASKQKLTFSLDKYNNERRPSLLWQRSQDLILLGQKNRAIGEMFTLVKTYPQHPDLAEWIAQLEGLVAPPLPAATTPTAAGAAPAVPPVVK